MSDKLAVQHSGHGVAKRDGSRRRSYRAPRLRALGDLRASTLGGSPGMGDTQNPMTEGNIPFYGDYIVMP